MGYAIKGKSKLMKTLLLHNNFQGWHTAAMQGNEGTVRSWILHTNEKKTFYFRNDFHREEQKMK